MLRSLALLLAILLFARAATAGDPPAKGRHLLYVGNYGDTVKEPRYFVIDPTGDFVLVGNQNGQSITVFRLNQKTGELTRVGDPTPCPTPVCLRFRVK